MKPARAREVHVRRREFVELDAIVTKLNQWASSRSAIRRLWIYGSRARGDAHPNSDLDVALELVVVLARGTGGGQRTGRPLCHPPCHPPLCMERLVPHATETLDAFRFD